MDKMELAENAPDYSEKANKRFYQWMYRRTEGLVQVCAFPVPSKDQDKSETGNGKWIHARKYKEFAEFCKTHSGLWRYHVYSGVNTLDTSPDNGRGGLKYIDRVDHLSFDIETKRDSYSGAPKEHVWWCYKYGLAQAKYMMEEYGVLPLVVMSENGIHLHYNVDFEVKSDKLIGKQHKYTKYLTHKAKNSIWAKKIKQSAPDEVEFDQDDVSDVPRVMKVPGTKGIKSENGRLCGIIHEPSSKEAGVIQSDDISVGDGKLDSIADKTVSSTGSKTGVDATWSELSDSTMDKVHSLAKNDSTFRDYWNGDLDNYKSRSESEFAFVIKMLNHDFSPDEIIEVMWASGMTKWDEESEHYRERTIENAIDYFDGDVVRTSRDASINFKRRSS